MSNDVTKRPALVWIVFIITLLGFIQICIFFGINNGLIQIGKEYSESLTQHQQFTLFQNVKMLTMNVIALFAGIMLFRLKSIAFKLYVLYAILTTISLIYSFIFPSPMVQNPFVDVTKITFYSKLASMFITFFLVYYSFRLLKKNILKT
jgi:hypothetical protein